MVARKDFVPKHRLRLVSRPTFRAGDAAYEFARCKGKAAFLAGDTDEHPDPREDAALRNAFAEGWWESCEDAGKLDLYLDPKRA